MSRDLLLGVNRWRAPPKTERGPLVIGGVTVPDEVIEDGMCAAYVSRIQNEGHVDDRAACPACHRERAWYEEQCSCGAAKPWLYLDEMPRTRVENEAFAEQAQYLGMRRSMPRARMQIPGRFQMPVDQDDGLTFNDIFKR